MSKVYAENISAVKDRPEFLSMLKACHSGKVGTILVWALDRLHRTMVGSSQTVLELDRLGVQVISVNEPWLDTSGPVRALLVGVFGWAAEQERSRISERTKAGPDRARRRGVQLGRPGFDLDLERARALRASGKSYRKIAVELGVSVGKVHERERSRIVAQAGLRRPLFSRGFLKVAEIGSTFAPRFVLRTVSTPKMIPPPPRSSFDLILA